MPKRRFVGRRNGAVQQRIPTTRVIRRDSESSIASTESLVDQGSSVGVSHVHQRNVEESPVFRFSDSDEEPSSRQRRRISSSASGSDDETESSLLQPPSRRVRGGLDYDSGAEDRNGGRGMRFARGSRPVSSVPPDTIDPRDCNNVSKSLRRVPCNSVQQLSELDGHMYCMLAFADGPHVPKETYDQILAVQHLKNSHIVKNQHIVKTQYLRPTFRRATGGGADILESMDKLVPIDGNLHDVLSKRMLRNREKDLGSTEIDYHCNYQILTGEDDGFFTSPCAPIREKLAVFGAYWVDEKGLSRSAMCFLYIVNTTNNFDLVGTLNSTIKRADEHNKMSAATFSKSVTKEALQELRAFKEMWYMVLLHQWHLSASVSAHFSTASSDLSNNPLHYLEQSCCHPAHPAHYLSIWEVYRSIRKHMGSSAREVYIQGFSETVRLTKGMYGGVSGLKRMAEWTQRFVAEKDRLIAKEKAVSGEKESANIEAMHAQFGESHAELPCALGWPIRNVDRFGKAMSYGIPPFDYIMIVDFQGAFRREQDSSQFAVSFGSLPPSVELGISNMMYQAKEIRQALHAEGLIPSLQPVSSAAETDSHIISVEDDDVSGDVELFSCDTFPALTRWSKGGQGTDEAAKRIPVDVFLDKARKISEFERMGKHAATDIMKSFCAQDNFQQQCMRARKMIRKEKDVAQKLAYRLDYLQGSLRQLQSTVLNGSLRSRSVLYATRYLKRAGNFHCKGLKKLYSTVLSDKAVQLRMVKESRHPWRCMDVLQDHSSPVYNLLMSPDSFQYYSHMEEVAYQLCNTLGSDLTAQNLKGAKEIIAGMVMHSMRSKNPGFIVLGAMVWWADGKGNFQTRMGSVVVHVVTKTATAGLDFTIETVNSWVSTHEKVLPDCHPAEDHQTMESWKGSTKTGFHNNMVMVSQNKVVKTPGDSLGQFITLNEGVSRGSMTIAEAVKDQIPRDGRGSHMIMTSVCEDNSNIRQTAYSTNVPGFQPFFLAAGNNVTSSKEVTDREREIAIVSYLLPTSGPVDTRGYVAGGSLRQEHHLHRGGINTLMDNKSRIRGDAMDDATCRLWSPILSFVPKMCTSRFAMGNKLGLWDLPINYGVLSLSNYLFACATGTLGCMITSEDSKNSSRFQDGVKSRMVAHCLLKRTVQCLMEEDSSEEAELAVLDHVTNSAVHLSQVPVMLFDLIYRMVQLPPLLALCTVFPYLEIPVIPLRPLLEWLDGRPISDTISKAKIKEYVMRCVSQGLFLPRDKHMLGDSVTPYVTGIRDLDVDSVHGQGGDAAGANAGNGQGMPVNPLYHVVVDEKTTIQEVVRQVSFRVWVANKNELERNCYIKDSFMFLKCMQSLQSAYDLRSLFGGMSLYSNARKLIFNATDGEIDMPGMPTTFRSGSKDPDPLMHAAMYPQQNMSAVGFRLFDAMLMYSLLQDPRRDTYVLAQFSRSVTEFIVQALPRSCMPYDTVILERLDPITGNQLRLDLRQQVLDGEEHDSENVPQRPECILRMPYKQPITNATKVACPGMGKSGVLEDELFMSTILSLASYIGAEHYTHLSLSMCRVDVGWQLGVCYPATWYGPEQRPEGRRIIYVHPKRFSTQLIKVLERGDWQVEGEWGVAPGVPGVVGCSSSDRVQAMLFGTGWGPRPYYRRPGVCLRIDADARTLGCIVPHSLKSDLPCDCESRGASETDSDSDGEGGDDPCNYDRQVSVYGLPLASSNRPRCYFCRKTPNYLVCTGSDGELVLMSPEQVEDSVVRVGTPLLLDTMSPEYVSAFGGRVGGAADRSFLGQKARRRRRNASALVAASSNVENREDRRLIVCRLVVPSDHTPRDGTLCVAVEARGGGGAIFRGMTNLYVLPQWVSMPRDAEETARAVQFARIA